MDDRRIVIWTTTEGEELSGRFMKFMALHDDHGYLTARALVEMNDGRVRVLDLDTLDFRFFILGGDDDR